MRQFNSLKVPIPPQKPHPTEWRAYSHLNLEIGSGTGKFADQFCLTHPNEALIAIEKTFSRSKQLLQKNIPNLFAYQSDAVAFITHYIENESLENIFILYPNPYLKKKQHNLRWHNRPFMGLLLQKLKPLGKLTLATNISEYAHEARLSFQEIWGMRVEEFVQIPPSTTPRTLFEKKYLLRNETCWNLTIRKPNSLETTSDNQTSN